MPKLWYTHRRSEAHPQGGIIAESRSLEAARLSAQAYDDELAADSEHLEAYERLGLIWKASPGALRARSIPTGQEYLINQTAHPPLSDWD